MILISIMAAHSERFGGQNLQTEMDSEEFVYTYDDPLDRGYKQFKLTKKQHNKLFPKRKIKWNTRYEYYFNKDRVILQRFTSYKAIILTTVMFPVLILFAGLYNIKEAITELKCMYNEKKYGKFSEEWITKGQFRKGDDEKYWEIINLIGEESVVVESR